MLKRLLISILLVFVILIAAPIVYIYQLSPDELKQSVSKLLSAKTHHQITIQGDMSWRVFPSIKLVINQVTIKPENKQSIVQGQVGQLLLTLDTWDLLRRQVSIEQIQLNRANLKLSLPNQSHPKRKTPNTKTQAVKENHLLSFSVDKIYINDSSFTVNHGIDRITLSNVDFKLTQHHQSQRFSLQTNLLIEQDNRPIKINNLLFSGSISQFNLLLNNPDNLKKIAIEAHLTGKEIDVERLTVNDLQAKVTLNKGVITMNNYQFSLADGKVVGTLDYDITRDVLSVNQKLRNINTKSLVNALGSDDYMIYGNLDLDWRSKTHPVNQDFWDNTIASGQLNYDNTLINLPKTRNMIDALMQSLPKILGHSPSNLQNNLSEDISQSNNTSRFEQLRQGSLEAQFKMGSGVVNPVLFTITHPKINASGELSWTLKNQAISGRMKLITSSIDKNVRKLQTMLNGAIPLILKGKITDIRAYPDMKAIAPLLVNQLVNKTGKEVIQNLGNQLLNNAIFKIHD
ncbi:AsmA family protein [Legionella sp. W05-934-2]|jgi:hypothetical protein|uniref:AsmA family protein n=1 Tax=Legionella sp. W05-934-2 TaxID=1198649 RepID=UPI0034637F83